MLVCAVDAVECVSKLPWQAVDGITVTHAWDRNSTPNKLTAVARAAIARFVCRDTVPRCVNNIYGSQALHVPVRSVTAQGTEPQSLADTQRDANGRSDRNVVGHSCENFCMIQWYRVLMLLLVIVCATSLKALQREPYMRSRKAFRRCLAMTTAAAYALTTFAWQRRR